MIYIYTYTYLLHTILSPIFNYPLSQSTKVVFTQLVVIYSEREFTIMLPLKKQVMTVQLHVREVRKKSRDIKRLDMAVGILMLYVHDLMHVLEKSPVFNLPLRCTI